MLVEEYPDKISWSRHCLDVSLCVIFVGISSQLTLSNTGWVLVLLGLTSEILHPFKLLIPLDLMYSTVIGIIMERERERERERVHCQVVQSK